jgi:UDP-glucose 4-epimerase
MQTRPQRNPRRTVVLTGGAGFIGSHIARALLERGFHVRLIDDLSTGRLANIAEIIEEIEWLQGDVGDERLLERALAGAEAVLHQAALPSVPRSVRDPLRTHEVNVTGTLKLLIAARDRGVRRVIVASSSSVYGDTRQLPKRETFTPAPLSPYAFSKLACEEYCRLFAHLYGLTTVCLRYFNVFGPRQNPDSQYAAVIPKFIRAVLQGEPPSIYGDGEQSRDFTYVANVVQANLAALDAPLEGAHVFNVGTGVRVTVNQLAAKITELLGASVRPRHVPPRPGDVRHSQADISAIRNTLGYEPRIGLEEGLRRTIASFPEASLSLRS